MLFSGLGEGEGATKEGDQKDYWWQITASRKTRILELERKAGRWHTFPLRRPRHIFNPVLSLDELPTTSIHTQSTHSLTTISHLFSTVYNPVLHKTGGQDL